MPMFPLGSVLLPGAILPLHVFEDRYRVLVRDCLQAEEPEFGVVLISRGSEVGGGEQRSSVGTVARMLQVAELDNGRFAVVCVGTRRIRVNAWLPDDPYPLADVDDWPDESDDAGRSTSDELDRAVAALRSRVRRACALATELGDSVMDATDDISGDPLSASYQLSMLAPIGPADQHALLAAVGAAARLVLLDDVMNDVEAQLEFRLRSVDELPLDDSGTAE